MTLRDLRRRIKRERINALKRFHRERQLNLLAEPGVHDFIIVLDNLKPNFNIGKIFRSADAFGAGEVHLINVSFFDPIPAKGSFKWVPARFHDTVQSSFKDLVNRGYAIYALEPGARTSLDEVDLPRRSAFVLGNEEFGLSFDPSDYPAVARIRVPQFGKVQSLNVSIAASLVMYEYVRQHGGESMQAGGPDRWSEPDGSAP